MFESSAAVLGESQVVYGNNHIQTSNVKWLRIKDIYPKLLKISDYDIGGAYNLDVPEYWFSIKTDQFGGNFMLHLFVANRQESSFTIELSRNSDLTHLTHKKGNSVPRSILSMALKTYNFKKSADNSYNFVTTFSFDSFDLKQLRDRELLIPIKISSLTETSSSIVSEVKLNHDLSSLLKDPVYSDFTIESSDGHKFSVHRAVLAAHSEVFKAMLKKETAESQNNMVRLLYSKEEVEFILQFIYTGTVKDMASCDWKVLLMLSDHFNLPGLSTLIQNALRRQINENNVIDIITHSDMHNCDLLKNAALKYISKNTKLVKKSESWENFKDPLLLKSIFNVMHFEL